MSPYSYLLPLSIAPTMFRSQASGLYTHCRTRQSRGVFSLPTGWIYGNRYASFSKEKSVLEDTVNEVMMGFPTVGARSHHSFGTYKSFWILWKRISAIFLWGLYLLQGCHFWPVFEPVFYTGILRRIYGAEGSQRVSGWRKDTAEVKGNYMRWFDVFGTLWWILVGESSED